MTILFAVVLCFFLAQATMVTAHSVATGPTLSPAGRAGAILKTIFHEDFFDNLFGGLFFGGICYGASWYFSSEGPQHPFLSAFSFLIFALPFSVPDTIDDFLSARFGRHSMAHVIAGAISCLLVFLLLALGFVAFFCATITLATIGIATGIVILVMAVAYIIMGANGYLS